MSKQKQKLEYMYRPQKSRVGRVSGNETFFFGLSLKFWNSQAHIQGVC